MAAVPRTENRQRPRNQRRADEGRQALNLVARWRLLTRAHVEIRTGSRRSLGEAETIEIVAARPVGAGPPKALQVNHVKSAADRILAISRTRGG